ncbi:MAG: hypothetical protein K2K35_06620 [Lachnospiraceae bacterium]|nr:hypothetical protein [Lachnospiraceae bacterium]
MEVKIIVTLPVIIIVALVATAGYIIVSKVAGRKWGYTEEREKELENIPEDALLGKRRKH